MKVENFLRAGIKKQRVGGKVASCGILLLIAKFIVTQQAAMVIGLGIHRIYHAAKSRNLNRFFAKHDMHQAEASADDAGTAKHPAHFFRGGIRCDVKIFRFTFEQQISHRTAHHIGLKTSGLQAISYATRRKTDAFTFDAMFFISDDFATAELFRFSGFTTRQIHDALKQFFYHYIQ